MNKPKDFPDMKRDPTEKKEGGFSWRERAA